ncbi:MAG: hypothetical protein IIV90_05905 [Oscillospiraceae bacterium]|nr:hypothetical protein [Oscillospiraceae bacterium]
MKENRAEKLFGAMNELDDRFVLEAMPEDKPALKASPRWKPMLSAAACFALVALAGVTFISVDLAAGGSSRAPAAAPAASAPAADIMEDSAAEESAPETALPPADNEPAELLPADPPKGGGDHSFDREYRDELYDVYIADCIVGREAGDAWANQVFLKKSPQEQDALPTLYQIIVDLNIPKEALEAKNEELGGELTREVIDALYLEDVEAMKQALTNPLALYYGGEIYTFDELAGGETAADIPAEVLEGYFAKIEAYCWESGQWKYMREDIERARRANGVEKDPLGPWAELTGYWNTVDEPANLFFAFGTEGASGTFRTALWEADGDRGWGTVEELAFNGEDRLWAMIYYPYQEATELRDEWPAGSVQLELDLSQLETTGLLKARYGEEEWKSFAFAGATQEEAFKTYVEQGS